MIASTLITSLAQTINKDSINIPKSTLEQSTLQDGLQIFFQIAGAVALLVIALGAFQYTISRGDANSIKKAKETIMYAAVGLLVTLAGYGIVTYVFTNL